MSENNIEKVQDLISQISDEKTKAAFSALVELVSESKQDMERIEGEIESLNELVESIDEDLAEVEDAVFELDEEDVEYEDVELEVECPDCKEIIVLDSDEITEIVCPNCGITIEIDYDCDCDDEDCECNKE